MRINLGSLNPLEQEIHRLLLKASLDNSRITITQAAAVCGVSGSKISKFVKKLGFSGYKEYLIFITGEKNCPQKKTPSEFERIKDFIENFDKQIAQDFAQTLLKQYDKILLFGYGPSGICAEYFEYKLNGVLDKNIISLSETNRVGNLLTEESILVIFSVTGQYSDFCSLYQSAKDKNAKVILVMEEYNSIIDIESVEVLFLTKTQQDANLLPYEKTRTIFFMFIEEVIRQIGLEKKKID